MLLSGTISLLLKRSIQNMQKATFKVSFVWQISSSLENWSPLFKFVNFIPDSNQCDELVSFR